MHWMSLDYQENKLSQSTGPNGKVNLLESIIPNHHLHYYSEDVKMSYFSTLMKKV